MPDLRHSLFLILVSALAILGAPVAHLFAQPSTEELQAAQEQIAVPVGERALPTPGAGPAGVGSVEPAIDPERAALDEALAAPDPVAAARPPATQPSADSLAKMLADLSSIEPEVREAARSNLMLLDRAGLPALRKQAGKNDMSAVTAATLEEIVTHVYLTDMHGFVGEGETYLGISSGTGRTGPTPEGGVDVSATLIGYDAYRALREGDRLVGWRAEGAEWITLEQFSDLLAARRLSRPGDWISLRVQRNATLLELRVRLASIPQEAQRVGIDPDPKWYAAAKAYWWQEFAPALRVGGKPIEPPPEEGP